MAGDDKSLPPTVPDRPRWDRPTDAATAARDDAERPDAPDPRYAIGDELGRGGMGRVVAATDTVLHRDVAIKQALTDDARVVMRFEREARITARLGHPAIVPVFDLGRDATGRPYYVMRRIEGKPLGALVAAATTVRERLALLPHALAAIDAAAFAHAQRVIHRDIKPWNILVGGYGETLLIDWGLARELDEADPEIPASRPSAPELTRAGQAYGTPGFMPPEQARGERVDARADVYALGATLFHLVTGELPQGSVADTAWLAHTAAGRTIELGRIPDEVSPELVAILAKAVAAERADRYADAGELAADLRRFLAGQLVAAHRYTARERLGKLVRRHKVAAAAIVLAIVTTAAIGVLAIVNVLRERDRADAARVDAETGKALALERGDQLLVDRAAAFADRDPTRAAALLATLPATSKQWPDARDVLAVAAAHGIAHGARVHRRAIAWLELAPDGRRVLTSSEDGAVHVYDLVTGAAVALVQTQHHPRAIWIDDRRVAVANMPELAIVEVASRAVQIVERGRTISAMWSSGDRLWFVDDTTHELVERELATSTTRVIATRVTDVTAAGDVALVVANGRLQLFARGTLTTLATAAPHGLDRAASPDRVAAVVGDRIVEWRTSDGSVVRTIPPLPGWQVIQLYYGRAGLIASRSDGRRRELHAIDGGGVMLDGSWSVLWHARSPAGDVFAGDDTLAVIGAGSAKRIAIGRTGLRGVVASPDGARIAVGATDGTLLWWTVADLVPRELRVDRGLSPCAMTDDRVLATSGAELFAIELATGARTPLADRATGCGAELVGGRAILLEGPRVAGTVDLRTGAREPLHGSGVVIDARADTFYTLDGTTVVERPHAGAPVERIRAPAGLTWFGALDGRTVVQHRDHRVVRHDRDGRETTLPLPGPVQALAIDGQGAVWFVRDSALWRWLDTPPVRIAALPGPVLVIRTLPAGGATLALADGSLWYATAAGMFERQPAGPPRVAHISERVAVIQESQALALVFPATGRRIVHEVPSVTGGVAMTGDGRRIAIATLSRPSYVLVYSDPVPVEPAAARAWLAGATNAVIEPGSDAIAWK